MLCDLKTAKEDRNQQAKVILAQKLTEEEEEKEKTNNER